MVKEWSKIRNGCNVRRHGCEALDEPTLAAHRYESTLWLDWHHRPQGHFFEMPRLVYRHMFDDVWNDVDRGICYRSNPDKWSVFRGILSIFFKNDGADDSR